MKKKIGNTFKKISDTVAGKELDTYSENKNIQKCNLEEEDSSEDKKNINERIEDLVNEMERNNHLISKIYSLRSSFFRGLIQGLGIVIGSTILAGMLYSMTVSLFGKDFIKEMTLNYILEQESAEKKQF